MFGINPKHIERLCTNVRMRQTVVGILGEHLGRRGVNPSLKMHKHVVHVEIKKLFFHNHHFYHYDYNIVTSLGKFKDRAKKIPNTPRVNLIVIFNNFVVFLGSYLIHFKFVLVN